MSPNTQIGSAPIMSTAFDPHTISECDAFALAKEITYNINLQLETLYGEPFDDQLVKKIDYYVSAVKSYYTSIGLYPLPFQYEVPIKIELKLCAGANTIDKTYVLESLFMSKKGNYGQKSCKKN